MNYELAISIKHKFSSDRFLFGGLEYVVMVTPKNKEDLTLFVQDYRVFKFDDSSALRYSKDGLFQVLALWTDGVNVLGKSISELNQ